MINQGMSETYIETRFLKDTQDEIKALAYKTNQSVCSISEFHINLRMQSQKEDPDETVTYVPFCNYIDLTPNNQYHCKLSLHGITAPIKLKIDYINTQNDKKPMTKQQMKQLKGNINYYLSMWSLNPQPAGHGDLNQKTYELSFQKIEPPKVIDIHSNKDKIPSVPFTRDWLYITIDCQDLKLINDLKLNIKAYPFIEKRMQSKGDKLEFRPSMKSDEPVTFTQELKEVEEAKRKALMKGKKSGLKQFKKEVYQRIQSLILFKAEYEQLNSEIKIYKDFKQNKRSHNSSTFLTNFEDDQSLDLSSNVLRSLAYQPGDRQSQMNPNQMNQGDLERYIETAYQSGDYIKLNALAT